ncbi:MAG: response regulator, partial [Cytophagales bacterium]|nr:response regulator [Cytophagales bacterium]
MEQDSRNFQDQVPEAHRDKSDFLANMRHELRTPVNAIIGYSEMLLEDAKDTDHKDFIFDLQNIHKAGKQVLSLINQILDPSKIEASKADIDLESFRVNIHYELRTPLNIIIGYSEMLLEDAEKLGQEDFISDLHKIYKAGKNLLDIIKDILKGSNFENVTVARDPKTSVRSTAIQDIPHIIHSPEEDNANTIESRKAFLLVVDDNEMNRDMLSRRLKRQGYMVAVAEDGYQALKMIKAQQFDLVLLDIMMPGINGLEVLCDLRKRYAMADLPIIMSSSKDRDEDIVGALQFGANDYVMKPIEFSVALARIKTQLSLKWAKEEIQGLAEQLEVRNSFIRKTFGRYLTNEIVDSLL